MRRRSSALAIVTTLAAATLLAAAPTATAASGPGDWSTWSKDAVGSRFNATEHRIGPGTVDRLKLKWAFTYPKGEEQGQGTPRGQAAVVGDTVYFGGPFGKLYARDARTGAERWTFDLTKIGGAAAGVQDSPAVARGKVYVGDTTGRLYAVDQRTGKLAWVRRIDDKPAAILTSSPMVYGGRVYVGVSSGQNVLGKDFDCCNFRGHVDALDADTGAQVWRHYSIPEPVKVGTWSNGHTRYAPSGGGVWSSPVIDPRTRTLYVGTGQNYTGSAGNFDSVLALDLRTGKARWTRKMTDVDTWHSLCNGEPADQQEYCPNFPEGTALDFDLGATANVFTAGARRLIGIGQKSGVYHVLDARTGEIVWQRQLGKPMVSGGLGGIQWGSSYDGRRLYIATYIAEPGALFALDPATGKVLWKKASPARGCKTGGVAPYAKYCTPGHPQAVTSTPGLVWVGGIDGKVRAYSSRTGEIRWTADTMREVTGVNGAVGRGGALSAAGGPVVSNGMVYVQSGNPFSPYPNDHGHVFLACGL